MSGLELNRSGSVRVLTGHGPTVLSRDAREAILLARRLGWSPEGRGTFWIQPEHGLEREALSVIAPDAST
ncbi:hypothetical protein [Myxococcus xanthus]|uniref:Uncharacterized protein n=1 Tax=Myxococcus xanthus TaxID=34 RepID=A0A7Y4MV32_MYXXA|nr:hypothetical protein [Myxococcus xanthus]NOJ83277.1 hypothetical protein [Myxococcus xanthus]NOJ88894.1 hypothetical protein [Myxococcus xanthus]